jgi:hypothetical protein
MLNSFCGYAILLLVLSDDLEFGFNVFIEMIKHLIRSTMLAFAVCGCVIRTWICPYVAQLY